MYVLKFSRRKNAVITSRGDSRLWLFISANVQETDCVTIISVLIGLDTQAVRNVQQYQVGTRETTLSNGVEGVESADCCAWPSLWTHCFFVLVIWFWVTTLNLF